MGIYDAEHSTRIQSFIAQLQPRDWNRMDTWEKKEDFDSRWDLDRYFDWPPDVFMLTSLLLQTSGAYRHALISPKGEKWRNDNWPKRCLDIAQKWRHWLCATPLHTPQTAASSEGLDRQAQSPFACENQRVVQPRDPA